MHTLFARPTQDWPVLGLQGQRLGTIVSCAVDAGTGHVKYLQLRTPWQTIDLQWSVLKFDEKQQSFKLYKHSTGGRKPHAAGDGPADSDS